MKVPREPGIVPDADGVFLLMLTKGDRTGIAYTIQGLIDMLDVIDGDPDFEDADREDDPAQFDLPGFIWGGGEDGGPAQAFLSFMSILSWRGSGCLPT